MSKLDETGYGRPPKHSRFDKGQSGNPKGRPKGARNLRTDLDEELNERISVREGSVEKKISKRRAVVKSLVANAAKGDPRAVTNLMTLLQRIPIPEEEKQSEELSRDEQELLEHLIEQGKKRNQTSEGDES